MLVFSISLLATLTSMAAFTYLLGLKTSLVIRINAAVVFGGIFVVLGLMAPEILPGLLQPMGYGIGLGVFLGMGFAWWKSDTWKRKGNTRFDFQFAARISVRGQRSISTLVVRLGIISIMLGVAVMEVTVSIVNGFQHAIHQKVIGFGSHIRIGNLLEELESEVTPLPRYNDFVEEIAAMEEVKNIAPYVMKPAMLKSQDPQEGVVLKGLDSLYDWSFFESSLVAGKIPDVNAGANYSPECLISQKIADLLDVVVGDKLIAFFFEDKVKVRRFNVTGIYKTDLTEFDSRYVMCDLKAVQTIWGWDEDFVAGFEVRLLDKYRLDDIEAVAEKIEEYLPYQYEATPITSEYPEIFEWVDLQHQNVWFILGLMVIVAVINMISVLLILILERTRTIGLLKALGMSNGRVWNLFVTNGFFLVLVGLVLGNLLGLGLLGSQELWGWLRVDSDSYFVDVVPVDWVWTWFLGVNMGVLAVCSIFMYIPALLVLGISPVRAMRFD